ncbi:YcdB/YcdC domain-containing protein [Paenibacillus sp. SYP-B4298]|uniref:YcdB/YcdC domain-containing protein n=1 Tax=Paenibacillus sp. SYP-B4298 TaxID=2996034 RepID=UPI0022DD58D4|nr:YcdB/YcdC domain-containing protein [Paenibacillus sp. SYP-B4298]
MSKQTNATDHTGEKSKNIQENIVEQQPPAQLQHLRSQAEQLFPIPEDYELVIEQLLPTRSGQDNEALFVWNMAGNEHNSISVTLSEQGKVLEYSLAEEADEAPSLMTKEQLWQLAESFVEQHHPGALALFPYREERLIPGGVRYTCSLTAMGLPLPRSGCFIIVRECGRVTDFKYYGLVEPPPIPTQIRPAALLLAKLRRQLQVSLQLQLLHESVYNDGDDLLHLVYAPMPARLFFPASEESEEGTMMELHPVESAAEQYESFEMEAWTAEKEAALLLRTPEEWLGVDEDNFARVRSLDLSDEVRGVVWQRRDLQLSKAERTLDALFEQQTAETVKAKFHKPTGRLLEFMRFTTPAQGTASALNRNECLQRALDAIRCFSPGLLPYLRLLRAEEHSSEAQEHFQFAVAVQGMPVWGEYISITVHRSTGAIEHYMGCQLNPEQLATLDTQPAFAAQEAVERFVDAIKLELQWELSYNEQKQPIYKLVYRAVCALTGREARLLDAHTGGLYSSRV